MVFHKNLRHLLLISVLTLPLTSHADFSDGVQSVTSGVGGAIEDVGTGVADAVKDVGHGIGNAVSDKPRSDKDIAKEANNTINQLSKTGKIAPGAQLYANCKNGVVHISGDVAKQDDIQTVKQAVDSISGVKSLTVNVQVKSN